MSSGIIWKDSHIDLILIADIHVPYVNIVNEEYIIISFPLLTWKYKYMCRLNGQYLVDENDV